MRNSIERRGLDINREFLDASGKAQEALAVVDAQLEGLLQCCQRIASALDSSRDRTGVLLRETAKLNDELKAVEDRKRMVATFLVDYQLTDEEIASLKGEDVTDTFFAALSRVQEIHANCRQLLRTHHQRAGLELMDVMATYQETAHERLCRWVQGECRTLAEEDGPDVPDLLARAMQALRARPVLYRYCVEEVSRTRHNALFRRFITALTRGGPGGMPRPIEVHAPDPQRYVGDMLGWLHQAVAGEKELVGALLGEPAAKALPAPRKSDGGGGGGEGEDAAAAAERTVAHEREGAGAGEGDGNGGEGGDEELADPSQVLDRILDGVCRPFKVRVEQVLAASPGVLASFKLANLLSFYRATLAAIVGTEASLVSTVEECRAAARASFDDQVSQRGLRLKKSPPPPTDTLAPPPFVAEGVQRVIELLEAQAGLVDFEGGVGGGGGGGGSTTSREDTTTVLGSVVDPVIAACERGAEMIGEMLEAHSQAVASTGTEVAPPPAAHVAPWAKRAYLINCLHAVQQPLRQFPAAVPLVESLAGRVAQLADEIVAEEAGRILNQTGVAEVQELIALYQGQHAQSGAGGAMSADPALALTVVGAALDKLVDAVSATAEPVPRFEEVHVPRVRTELRSAYTSKIIEAYTLVYVAVLNPSNGYRNAQKAIRHGPNALSTILGGV